MKDKNLVVVVLGNRLNDDGTITKIQEKPQYFFNDEKLLI